MTRSIKRFSSLLSAYSARPSIFDALNALSIIEDTVARAGSTGSLPPLAPPPTLTALAAKHLRKERGRARAMPPLTLSELFERHIARYGLMQTRTIQSMKTTARFFVSRLGADSPVAALAPSDIENALSGKMSACSYNHHLTRLRTAVSGAVRAGLMTPEQSPVQGIALRRIVWNEPGFLSPGEVEKIFRVSEEHPGAIDSGIGAFLTLGFFAGVRTAEILRARWEDIDLADGGVLRIPRPKGFTRGTRPRIVELEPCAVEWMRLWRDWTLENGGSAAGKMVRDAHDVQNWKAERLLPLGLAWGKGATRNAPRHTYATMHVAAFRNAPATALNLGHGQTSTMLLDRHYRGLASAAEAAPYWRIMPARFPAPPEPRPGQGRRTDLERGAGGA